MSVQATTWAWEHSTAAGNDLLVLLAVADAANAAGERSCQSAATIADMARVSVRTVRRSLRVLEESGELVREGVARQYGGTTIYRLPGVSTGGPVPRPGGDTGVTVTDCHRDKTGQQGVTNQVAGGDSCVTQPQFPTGTTQKDNPSGAAVADARPGVLDGQTDALDLRPAVDLEPKPWAAVAKAAYDGTDGALNFMGMQGIARWAIEKKSATPDAVEAAIASLWRGGRAVTKQTVAQVLDGHLHPGGGPGLSRRQQEIADYERRKGLRPGAGWEPER